MRKPENARTGAGGMVVGSDTPLSNSSKELAGLADRYRLPAIFQDETIVKAGGLVAYGMDFDANIGKLLGNYAAAF
jgi:ABC-type uncharacterized transport system substrate-binding protein